MKRFSFFAMLMVSVIGVTMMIGAVGLAGAEASSKSPTGRVIYKESRGLKGPVREFVLESDHSYVERSFSKDGRILLVKSRILKNNEWDNYFIRFDELEREILTFFGLNNSFEKKERLLVDEVNSNNDYINRNVDIMYANRQVACEELNKKFGLNVKVSKNNNFENSYDQEGEEEGEVDE